MIIGIDPGFKHFGYALLDNGLGLMEMGTIRTEKCSDYDNATDIFTRCAEIHETIRHRVLKNGADVFALCVEGMSYPRNASSAVKLGAAHGVVASLYNEWYPEVVSILSPQAIRKAVTGKNRGYTEEETHFIIQADEAVYNWVEGSHKWKQPHALDAYAAALAAKRLGYFDEVS